MNEVNQKEFYFIFVCSFYNVSQKLNSQNHMEDQETVEMFSRGT